VESRRINGEPRTAILEYLGTAETLLERLKNEKSLTLSSYSHGDTAALLGIASELGVIEVINKHVKPSRLGKPPKRDGLSVGGSLVLAAIGRACCPTSKDGWYDWAKTTSLEYCLRSNFKNLDSQHFWDQMHAFPVEGIAAVQDELIGRLIEQYDIKLDTLLFDATNFFTFIASTNNRCTIAKRGKSKQKRYDLRLVGLALLVTREEQFPLFHKAYQGNRNDSRLFKEVFGDLVKRLSVVSKELSDVTFVFDKGNNSKKNFEMIDAERDCYYVGSLVPSYFKDLIKKANDNFEELRLKKEKIPVFRAKIEVWGKKRTCVVLISEQLRQGQIRGIEQALTKKYAELDKFKARLENSKRRKKCTKKQVEARLDELIDGQFVKDILRYELIKVGRVISFEYYLEGFDDLQNSVLGRRILVTNRDTWSTEEIILAYRAQSKVEYAFRTLKNPYHLAIRPQFHWTDQKIEVHFFICIIGYLLAIAAYTKARAVGYRRNIDNFMDELRSIRLAAVAKTKGRNVLYQIEKIPHSLKKIATKLAITSQNIRPNINFSDYS